MKSKLLQVRKMLLVAAGLLVGASAWAEEWSIDFAALGSKYDDKTNVTISKTVATIGGTTMGTCTVKEEALNANFVLQTETAWLMRQANGLYQNNGGNRAMGMLNCTAGQIITIVGTGDPNPQANATLKSQDKNTYKYTVDADGDVKFNPVRYLYFTFVSVENPSTTSVNYTVKYVDESGNQLKEEATYDGEPGSAPTISETDKAAIYTGDKKYIYKSDDASSQTIVSEGTTIVTITFREAATYSYTVNAIDGENKILAELANTTGFEGDVVSVPFARVMNVDGTIYTSNTAGNVSCKISVTLDSDKKVVTKAFSPTKNTNVCFFTEAEDIEGMTAVYGGGADARSSYAAGGYSADYAEVTTLEAGVYTLTAAAYANATFSFKAGEEEVHTLTLTGLWGETTSAKFAIHEETTLYAKGGNGNDHALDYVYVQRVSDVPATISAEITTAGWATLYTDYALDFSKVEGLTAYTATCDGEKVTLTLVDDVPAKTGVVLKGATKAYDIPLTPNSDTAKGDLKGSTTAELAYNNAATKDYYMLALNEETTEVQFTLLGSGSIAAGKAYLELPKKTTAAEARVLNVVFAGETTGIAEVATAGAENGAIYNLSGQRVSKPANGLYIVNGKKVVIK